MPPNTEGRDHQATASPKAAEPPRARRRPTLLVVDDEAEVLQSIRDMLRIDYQVVTRDSGEAALEFLAATPDVAAILSDQRMPVMTGVEVLRRAAAVRPETTRLLFTAFAELVDTYGEEAVAKLAEGLPARIRKGEYSVAYVQQ